METIHNPVTAAKEIKKRLSALYPGVKFSARSEYYAGGNSINISWNFGPTVKQGERIADRYQEGNFDGMTDCYNYEPTLVLTEGNEVKRLGGAKYVFCTRSYDDAADLAATAANAGDFKAARQYWNDEKTFFQRAMKEVCTAFNVPWAGQYTLISSNGRTGHDDVSSVTHQLLGKTDFTGKQFAGIKKLPGVTSGSSWADFLEVCFK